MAEFDEATRAIFLDTLSTLVTHVSLIFSKFKIDCKHREGVGCGHKDYHKDFALADICRLEDCPVMEEEV